MTLGEDHPVRVIFRVDASLEIGTGHVMRCLTLADALAATGSDCIFICREHLGHLIDLIRNKGYLVHALPLLPIATVETKGMKLLHLPFHAHWLGCGWDVDAEETKSILLNESADWLILDHYALDEHWEKELIGCYKKLMVIDDLADRRHICDLLLDQNLGRDSADYETLVPAHCTCLIGPKYALLRPEFAALREYSLNRRQTTVLRRLLITMGGVDQLNATCKVLEALLSCSLPSDCQITVVMGARAPWLKQVQALAAKMPSPTDVRVNVANMAEIMAESDLAIGAAGSTSWERCCLGLPALVVVLAENQQACARALDNAGAAILLNMSEQLSCQLLETLRHLSSSDHLAEMSHAARAVTDGNGTCTVVKNIRYS